MEYLFLLWIFYFYQYQNLINYTASSKSRIYHVCIGMVHFIVHNRFTLLYDGSYIWYLPIWIIVILWDAIFTLAPLSAIYYPVETLPEWIRWLSLSFPQTYVFEGMRDILFNNNFNVDYYIKSLLLNAVYAVMAVFVFLFAFEGARKRGGLINTGE